MKKILGLDIGTNSVGGALISIGESGSEGHIEWMGSRIIPVDNDSLQKFESGGQVETKAAARRLLRGSRRLKQRYKLRRSRLITVFKMLGWVAQDFPEEFKNHPEGFRFNINQYLPVSDASKEEAYKEFRSGKISDDWLVYYLRKKGLTRKLTLQELARIIYILNQRRGFKSSRKDVKPDEESGHEKWPKLEKWVEILKVDSVEVVERDKERMICQIKAGGYFSRAAFRYMPDWAGEELELEVTKKTTKAGEVSFAFRKPDISDWEKQRTALNSDVYEWFDKELCKTIGEYFCIHLCENKNYRIRQRIVDRELYRKELLAIWEVQRRFHSELSDSASLQAIARVLYRCNKDKQKEISSNDLLHLISDDIIYYQRPLKSKKHSIDICRFEKKFYADGTETMEVGVKVTPKSSPEFQEFRIWQDIHNLRIFQREATIDGKLHINLDVTDRLIAPAIKEALFDLFDANNEVTAPAMFRAIDKTLKQADYFINLFSNREKLKGNETKAVFTRVFKKHGYAEGEDLLADPVVFHKLWHILYSLPDEKDILSALCKIKAENGVRLTLPKDVIAHLSKLPELPGDYAAYSSKAIKKLLPLMRCGRFWRADDVSPAVYERIEKALQNDPDNGVDERTAEFIERFANGNENYHSGMPVWLATYIIYGKHSERSSTEKYTNPEQIDIQKLIPSNSLRNPIVEQVVRETLQVVKDVWKTYGQPDEIHVELARELKKTAEERDEISRSNAKSNIERERIKKLLIELKQGNPQSTADVEKFKLWKTNGGSESSRMFDELFTKRNEFVSQGEIEKYRLWADQNHLSPYTGRPIPLSKLFDKSQYEIEHIFPRKRFFDNSFANKVICEAGVNKLKGAMIARIFIQSNAGSFLEWGGQQYPILDDESYVEHCKKTFNGKKLRNLLAESIPADFVSRQLNDTRHITRKLAELLYPAAKDKEGMVFTGGSITSELKDRWGLNKVWKELLVPRFQRLEEITGMPAMIPDGEDANKFHFTREYKRVDHRHHALDALVIAATRRNHIQYLNTLNASDGESAGLRRQLTRTGYRDFKLPWPTFTQDAKSEVAKIIVSHKATNRVVTKPFNKYLKWVEKDGEHKKEFVKQLPPVDFGKSWTAIRRSMFKEPQGVIYLKEVVFKKIADAAAIQIKKQLTENKHGQKPADYVYDQKVRPLIKQLVKQFNADFTAIKTYLKKNALRDGNGNVIETVSVAVFKEFAAKRVAIDKTFDEKKIAKIPYAHHRPSNAKNKTLPQLLSEHLSVMGTPEAAFTGEGLSELHKKLGFPLRKVTIYEAKEPSSKFQGRYYETDKGGNVFFVIKERDGKREMFTLPLLEAIDRLANKLPLIDSEEGCCAFTLSPNELVYVPDEGENPRTIDWSNQKYLFEKVYKMVSCSGSECYFLPHNVANLIMPYDAQTKKGEFGSLNKTENTVSGVSIKRNCIKLKVDRLGKITPA